MIYQRVDYPNGYKKILKPFEPCPSPNIPKPINDKQVKENNPTPTLNLFPVDEGYIKGTIFRGLYRPYKNYTPIQPNLTDEKDRMLFDVNKYHFAMKELQFYLDNFPDDEEALKIFNNYRIEYLKAKQAYENKFGALNISSSQLANGPWNWVETMAPWEMRM